MSSFMANGDYNQGWCKERHDKIDRELQIQRQRMDSIEQRQFNILKGTIANIVGVTCTLLGISAVLFKLLFSS